MKSSVSSMILNITSGISLTAKIPFIEAKIVFRTLWITLRDAWYTWNHMVTTLSIAPMRVVMLVRILIMFMDNKASGPYLFFAHF